MPFNGLFHRHFTGLIIPDISPCGGARNLSGKLCRSRIKSTIQRSYYAGILTSTRKMNLKEDLDYLAIVSGPEPQRSALEKIILRQIQKLPGEKAVLLGSPRQERHEKLDASTTVHSYVSTEEKARLMNRARFIISRSGYTTMMEMAELDKKHALLTPTPGQTEQEYLSRYYAREGWFLSRSQYRLRSDGGCKGGHALSGLSGDGQDRRECEEAVPGGAGAASGLNAGKIVETRIGAPTAMFGKQPGMLITFQHQKCHSKVRLFPGEE